MWIIVILLTLVVFFCLGVIIFRNNQLEYYKVISKNLSSMRVIQCMFEIMGSSVDADTKIEELNKVAIDSYNCKYSSIVVFDGNKYELKASNVEENYIDSMLLLYNEHEFKKNVDKNISKYITTSYEKTLNYNSAIERNIKSCIFSPIYHGDIFLGYWIIEDDNENAFDDISKSELSKLKNNMGVFLESVVYENVIESIENTDKQTGLNNTIYLYSKGRKELLKHENNCIAVLSMKNLSEINLEYSRQFGNILFDKVIQLIKEYTTDDTIKIRYSGAKILMVYTDSTSEVMHSSIERLLSKIKSDAVEEINNKEVNLEVNIVMKTIKKQSNIEKEVENILSYVDQMKETNTIKII